ncbi:MAG: ribonuclease P protein component [Gammaproteobacteria bacterium]|nr:ribonuclease P protein component [Gammaproteobacteria bacterium]
MSFLFKRQQRLTPSASFKHVFQRGIRVRHSLFSCAFVYNELTYSRIGIVIAKRNVKRAVARNRIKRIAREVFRHNSVLKEINVDLIVVAYKGADQLDNCEVRECLEILLKKLQKRLEK